MTYAQKLRDPKWQRKRLEILQRDNWTCQCCQSKDKTLQVHHLFYAKKDPWDYPDEAYQTLCEECHEERQAIVDPLIERLRVSVAKVPTERLAATILGADPEAKVTCATPFQRHVMSTLRMAMEATSSGNGFFEEGLFYDALMNLLWVQCNGRNMSRAELEKKSIVISMALEKIA